jgi:hypothetical protein
MPQDGRLFYFPNDIARMTGLTRRTINRYMANGTLVAKRLNPKRTLITRESVERWLAIDEPAHKIATA